MNYKLVTLLLGVFFLTTTNVYKTLDKLYGYELISYKNFTEIVPTETFNGHFDVFIEPHTTEAYLLGSFIEDTDVNVTRNITVLLSNVCYSRPSLFYELNSTDFNATVTLFRYRNHDNSSYSMPLYHKELEYNYYDEGGYNGFYLDNSDANWLVLSNNNNHSIYVKGYYKVNDFYILSRVLREVINMPFMYYKILNMLCVAMMLIIGMIL